MKTKTNQRHFGLMGKGRTVYAKRGRDLGKKLIRTLFVGVCLSTTNLSGIVAAQEPARKNLPWLKDVSLNPLKQIQEGESSGTGIESEPRPLISIPNFSSESELKDYQVKTRQEWAEFLGAFEVGKDRQAPRLEILETVQLEGGLVQQLVRYETEPGQHVEAFILRPSQAGVLRPGAVVFHSTYRNSIHQCVGGNDPGTGEPPNDHEMRKAYALHLAKRGFITLSPRNYLWSSNERMDLQGQTKLFLERNPERKGMARMLFDAIVAVDVLTALEGVDANRIAAIGHSLGAKEVLYAMAFDPRIKVGVSSEGGIGISQSNWNADWYLSKVVDYPEFQLDHHQLVACVAPRPLLVIGGDASDGEASARYMVPALPAYRLMGEPVRLGLFNHKQGHSVPEESLKRSLEWIEHHIDSK